MDIISDKLNLSGVRDLSLEGHDFHKIQDLCLSYCSLKQYPDLSSLPDLVILDVSHNSIHELVDGLQTSLKLQNLDISANFILSAENIRILKDFIPGIQKLDLRFNPINFRKGYRSMIISVLENLSVLDCQEIIPSEKVIFNN